MSEILLELAAVALGDLTAEVTFVGAATLPVWITDESVLPVRITEDIDVVVEVSTKAEYDRFSSRLRELEMYEDSEGGVMCRWRIKESDLVLDVMPSDQKILGFDGVWLSQAGKHARPHTLPNGTQISIATPAYLLAMKLEAFGKRGAGDYFRSKDFEDIVTLVSGREEIVQDVIESDPEVRRYIAGDFARLIQDAQLLIGLEAQVNSAPAAPRVDGVIMPRLTAIAALGQ